QFATSMGVATSAWPECVEEVLEDSAMRFALDSVAPPRSLVSYLLRAVRNRALNLMRRDRALGETTVDVERVADDEQPVSAAPHSPLVRIGAALRATLSTEEEL